jgi:hypothetical protein
MSLGTSKTLFPQPARYELKWEFLIHGPADAVKNLEQYFFSFYRIDVDMAIAIVIYLAAGPKILSIVTSQSIPCYSVGKGLLLLLVIVVFVLDAFSLRREMKKYIP